MHFDGEPFLDMTPALAPIDLGYTGHGVDSLSNVLDHKAGLTVSDHFATGARSIAITGTPAAFASAKTNPNRSGMVFK